MQVQVRPIMCQCLRDISANVDVGATDATPCQEHQKAPKTLPRPWFDQRKHHSSSVKERDVSVLSVINAAT